MMATEPVSSAFLFSVQRALPEMMPADLSGVTLDADEKTLYIRCYFDGPASAEDREFMSYLQDAVMQDFFPPFHVEVEAVVGSEVTYGLTAYRRPVLILS
jgi:hypothetical protein